jgi:hypothetical protein
LRALLAIILALFGTKRILKIQLLHSLGEIEIIAHQCAVAFHHPLSNLNLIQVSEKFPTPANML